LNREGVHGRRPTLPSRTDRRTVRDVSVFIEVSGRGSAAILLLHGLGATGAVWRQTVLELGDLWTGRIVTCDLPGHGDSAALPAYSYPAVAEAVAEAIPPCESLVIVGHSFGGVVAALLASGEYRVKPDVVVAASVKVTWSPEERAGLAALAAKPVRWFPTKPEAVERYRRVSGLTAEVSDDPADLDRGVVEQAGQWRLSYDPAIWAIGAPDMAATLSAADCAVLLCRGVDDPMVTATALQAFGVETLDVPGAGHNVHVEQPRRFALGVVEFLGKSSPTLKALST
jgi:pimeloyl-ACP methyl ester carboxylesterase